MENIQDEGNQMDTSLINPVLKWVGGKTQILDKITDKIPKTFDTYYEPFVGGGSVFLQLLKEVCEGSRNIIHFKINDLNTDLITLYQTIQSRAPALIAKLTEIVDVYNGAPSVQYPPRHRYVITPEIPIDELQRQGKSYVFYYYRQRYNSITSSVMDDRSAEAIEKSALLIFLNKTCFRGLYRVGKNGFNVPFGNYDNPSVFNSEQLLTLHKAFTDYDVEFSNADFATASKGIKKRDFVYFDPPYYPIEKESFTSYNLDGFDENHTNLLKLCKVLKRRKIPFLQSNSCSPFILENYKKFTIEKVLCRRRINSKNPEATENEVFITA